VNEWDSRCQQLLREQAQENWMTRDDGIPLSYIASMTTWPFFGMELLKLGKQLRIGLSEGCWQSIALCSAPTMVHAHIGLIVITYLTLMYICSWHILTGAVNVLMVGKGCRSNFCQKKQSSIWQNTFIFTYILAKEDYTVFGCRHYIIELTTFFIRIYTKTATILM